MDFSRIDFSKKEKITIISAVTIGNLLEWYEIYLYIYWAPKIAKLFFSSSSHLGGLTYTYLIFALGFLARPIGGIFFGRLGDRIGRKKALILSLIIMIFPTVVTGLLPTYATIGHFAPFTLTVMRLLQAFPAGGELPGAMCYLYESAKPHERKFLTSWTAYGYQMGILISTMECFILEKLLTPEQLETWGWRFSFLIGGLIGCFGLFLRTRLHETPLYREMHTHEKIVREPILKILIKNRKGIGKVFLFCALNSSSFYLLSVNFPAYFVKIFKENYNYNLIVTAALLLLITIPLPFFGKLADKYSYKKMLIYSTLGMILLLYPLSLSLESDSLPFISSVIILYGLLFACASSVIPYAIATLFPTHDRFTCVGFSFNTVDAILGGFTPALSLLLFHMTGNRGSFCWILLLFALLSFFSYFLIRENHHVPGHKS